MPNRLSAAFRRKSAVSPEDIPNTRPTSTEHSTFRVLERNPPPGGRGFDGGARMARTPANPATKHASHDSDSSWGDNMFAGLNTYGHRGSGGSNTTKATSTATSSRHSNASTAPSSADMAHGHDDKRGKKRVPAHEPTSPQAPKSTSSFLDRAGRTFSFGMQKKNAPPPPKDEPVPDVPPLPTLQRQDETGRTRAMTASTASTATPPRLENGRGLDLGGDFASMFTGFGKRSSATTLRNEPPADERSGAPTPLTLDTASPVDAAPSSSTLSPAGDRGQHAPRHQASFEYRSSASPGGVVEDADAKLLADSVAATKFLSDGPGESNRTSRYWQDQSFTSTWRKPVGGDEIEHEHEHEDNLFAGTPARFSGAASRSTPAAKPSSPPAGKVMTAAEFEKLKKEREREHLEKIIYGGTADDDDSDEINYDDDYDEQEKLKADAKLRRQKADAMIAYRQKNMKTVGGTVSPAPPPSRPHLPSSLSAPQLGTARTPSPGAARQASEEDDDEDIPLGILQAQGLLNKGRGPSRLSMAGAGSSNPNLRATALLQAQVPRLSSAMGEPASAGGKRASVMPVFARGLPQDVPFMGGNASRQSMQPQPIHPHGLVGVIADEERARAKRRGSPNIESQRLRGAGVPNDDPFDKGPQLGYGGFQRSPQTPAAPSPAEKVQLQMSQQMTQFMQMQMQFMQMMAGNQGMGAQHQQMPQQMQQQMQQMHQQMQQGMSPQQQQQMQQMQQQMQQYMSPQQQQQLPPQHPYGMFAGSQSFGNLSLGRQSMSGQYTGQPRRMDAGSRTMSMVQPSTSSAYLHTGYSPPQGYTQSIAPSERSNVGLPGRYRPVSQASGSLAGQPMHQRSTSASGTLVLSQTDGNKSRSTIRVVAKPKIEADDDDEEGWEAMRAKRDQKKSRWRVKKGNDD